MTDDRKRYIGTALADEDYHALIRMATRHGKHPSDLIREYVQRGVEEDIRIQLSEGHDVGDLAVYATLRNVQSLRNTRSMLRQIAAQLVDQNDEELADRLMSLCEQSNVDFETIMAEAQDMSASVGLVGLSIEQTNSLSACRVWLKKVLNVFDEDGNYGLPSTVLYKKAAEQGFKRGTLDAAKKELGVVAERRSRGWAWVLPMTLRIPPAVEVRTHGG